MKRIITLSVLSLLVCIGSASGQTRFGIMAGCTSSSSDASLSNFSTKNVSLYHAGITMEIPIAVGLSIQPSVIYQVKGTTLDEVTSGTKASFDTKVGYVEVPVDIQWGPDLLVFRPYVFAEPFIGFGVTNKTSTKAGTSDDVVSVSETLQDKWQEANIRRWEYGLGLGGGIDIWKLQLSARYFWNFGPLSDDDGNVDTDAVANTVKDAFKNDKNFNGVCLTAVLFF